MSGMVIHANGGGGSPRPVDPGVPPATPNPTTAVPGPAPVSPGGTIDDAYLFDLAKLNLPDNTDRQDFLDFSRNHLPQLAQTVVSASDVNLNEFETAMTNSMNTVREQQEQLNKKTVTSK